MKIKILATALLSIFAAVVNAQQLGGRHGGDPMQRAEMQTKMMADSLYLSARQSDKVKAINLSFAEKQKAARANTPEGEWDKMRASMDSLRNAHNAELKTVLTLEQYNHWQTIAERQFKRMGNGERNSQSPPPPTDEKERKEKAKGRKDDDLSPPPRDNRNQ